jgi:hypothetical protein
MAHPESRAIAPAGSSLASGALPSREVAAPDSFQGPGFFERQADVTGEGKGVPVTSAGPAGVWRSGMTVRRGAPGHHLSTAPKPRADR